MLGNGPIMTIFGHFSINNINSFHETEDLTVILVCPIYANLNWIKSYDSNYNFCFVSIPQFCKKKNEKLQLVNGRFTTISGHFLAHHTCNFHKTQVQVVILMYITSPNLNWFKSYDTKSKYLFTFCDLDGANSIKTDLHICNLWTGQLVSYKSVIEFLLNLPKQNSKK